MANDVIENPILTSPYREPSRLADIERECPGVGRDWIRSVRFTMRDEGGIGCTGKGKAATWHRTAE
jgi:hypothetical protein